MIEFRVVSNNNPSEVVRLFVCLFVVYFTHASYLLCVCTTHVDACAADWAEEFVLEAATEDA